jgi:hypothetical protein
MAANKFYLSLVNGVTKLYEAITASVGVGSANKIIATNAAGKLDATFLPPGVAISANDYTSLESLSAGDFVYISGANVGKADATNPAKSAQGYVLDGVAISTTVTVYDTGTNSAIAATGGAIYWLDPATPGGATSTPPSNVDGNIIQILGKGNAAGIYFEPDPYIEVDIGA